jgi:calmodulin
MPVAQDTKPLPWRSSRSWRATALQQLHRIFETFRVNARLNRKYLPLPLSSVLSKKTHDTHHPRTLYYTNKQTNKLTNNMSDEGTMREAFGAFDKNGIGTIQAKEFPSALRAAGNNPSDADCDKYLKKWGTGSGPVTYDQFVEAAKLESRKVDSVEEVCEAYKNFDKDGNGTINSAELRHIMTNLGEKLTNEECDELLREADIDSKGMINYKQFVMAQMGK